MIKYLLYTQSKGILKYKKSFDTMSSIKNYIQEKRNIKYYKIFSLNDDTNEKLQIEEGWIGPFRK